MLPAFITFPSLCSPLSLHTSTLLFLVFEFHHCLTAFCLVYSSIFGFIFLFGLTTRVVFCLPLHTLSLLSILFRLINKSTPYQLCASVCIRVLLILNVTEAETFCFFTHCGLPSNGVTSLSMGQKVALEHISKTSKMTKYYCTCVRTCVYVSQ